MKWLIATVVLYGCLFAQVSLEDIKNESPSYAKDLFLWQAMQERVSNKNDVWQAFMLTKKPKKEHINILTQSDKTLDIILSQDILAQFSFNFWQNFNGDKKNFIQNLAVLSPQKAQLAAMSIADDKILYSMDTDTYADLFIWVSSPQWRKEHLDFTPLTNICENSKLTKLIKKAFYSQNEALFTSLYLCETQDGEALFYLGLNSYKNANFKQATQFFIKAKKFATTIEGKERADYWSYKASKDEIYLKNAANSGTYYYGALARIELNMGLKPILALNGYNQNAKPIDINMSNPFEEKLTSKYLKSLSKQTLEDLKQNSKQPGFEPLWVKISNIQNEPKAIYITPYLSLMQNESAQNLALWLAIGRQESQFFPNDISSAWAIGVMQIIPDLSHDINPKIKPLELLDPNINIPLAITHFKKLKNIYNAPAFVAIAFNAGPGYVKKLNLVNHFAQNDKLLALESIDYDETRQYIRRVILNYIIYCDILGVKIDKKAILQNPFLPFHNLH